jgi:hypothetical protein
MKSKSVMYTLSELIQKSPVYLNDWVESKRFGVIIDFEDVFINQKEYEAKVSPYPNSEFWLENKAKADAVFEKYKDVNILFASYGYANYSGDAWVLFEEGGNLYEVNGGHCSCYGLEGQWEKEPVVLEELKNRLEKGSFGTDSYSDNEFAKELKEFLGLTPPLK